ncbi:transposase [Azorhizophilus paspali]|uniref:Transposase n=1 Tax=Azorhizophilus paspali TaxID=69963 RepID=A0ABV6SIW5_AZOPA
MPRLMLSDERWSKLENVLLQQTVYHKPDLRMTVEGMLYRMHAGCPWRDLLSAFGRWSLGLQALQCVVGGRQVAQGFPGAD